MIAASLAMERRLRERRSTRPGPYSKISESRPEASSAPSWPMPATVMHHGGGDWSPRERRRRMASVPRHDRQFLLMGAKRNAVLELQEIERYGIDSYGDADWVSIYGLRPAEWYARGVRMLGRTAVECTRDRLGDAIGRHVATVVRQPSPLVVDLFAGSGNTLYWLLRHLPRARGVGFEIDPMVFALTRDNLAALALPVEILDVIGREISASPLLCVIQVLERLVPGPLAEVRTRFDWSELQIFHLNAP